MEQQSALSTIESDIAYLETRIDDLVQVCAKLTEENESLKDQQLNLVSERAKLIEKNEMARARIEDILNRLRGMERSA